LQEIKADSRNFLADAMTRRSTLTFENQVLPGIFTVDDCRGHFHADAYADFARLIKRTPCLGEVVRGATSVRHSAVKFNPSGWALACDAAEIDSVSQSRQSSRRTGCSRYQALSRGDLGPGGNNVRGFCLFLLSRIL
jgi:hypothetical protein